MNNRYQDFKNYDNIYSNNLSQFIIRDFSFFFFQTKLIKKNSKQNFHQKVHFYELSNFLKTYFLV